MAGCKQFFTGRSSATAGVGYMGLAARTWVSTSCAQPWRIDGDFRNAYVSLTTAPGVGTSWTFTLMVNGLASSLSVTVSDLSTSGSSSAVVYVTAGDTVAWGKTVSGVPSSTGVRLSVEFNGATAGQSCYGGADQFSLSSSLVYACPLFHADQLSSLATFSVAAANGTITELSYRLTSAPGTGKSYTLSITKNLVAQNGTGGTPDTRVTISDLATTGSWTGTLSVTAGDHLYLRVAPTGSPAAGQLGFGVVFLASTDGQSHLTGMSSAALVSGATRYAAPMSMSFGYDATEANVDAVAPSALTLSAFRAHLDGTPGGTNSPTFTTRVNGATPAGAPTCSVASASTSASDLVNSVSLVAGDTFDVETSGTVTAGRLAAWSWLVTAASSYVPPGGAAAAIFERICRGVSAGVLRGAR